MKDNLLVSIVTRYLLVPVTLLFGCYVIAHGEGGPGGGFQGGVIIASGFALFTVVFGAEEGRKLVSRKTLEMFVSLGVLIYIGIGIACMAFGGMFLQYNVLPFHDPHLAAEMGILAVEIGIGMTVASAITLIFLELANND